MRTHHYPSDVTDEQWALIGPHIPVYPGGRPRKTDTRDVLDAVFYILRTGCQWRYLPVDFPPKSTVRRYFDEWRHNGTLETIHDTLRRKARTSEEPYHPRTTAGVDSQSADTTSGGEARGRDNHKNVDGRKRHIVVDSMGSLLTGGPEVLKIEEVDVPPPGKGEVQIAVKALGLNRVESMFRRGEYVEQPELPARNGYEAAGIVAAVGEGVQGFKAGDAVSTVPAFSLNQYGAYGDPVNVPAHAVAHHPASSSSVGLASIQIANKVGAVPIALTRGTSKRQALLDAGAKHVIDSDEQDRLERGKVFINEGLADGSLRPIIARAFPFDEIVEALRYMESNQQVGKIVVTV